MNPNGEPFSAAGPVTLVKKTAVTNCTAILNGTITSTGIVNITSTQFVGATGAR